MVRLAERFHFSQFRRAVAKYVREGWVPEHGGQWRNQHLVTNELARDPSKRILPKNFF